MNDQKQANVEPSSKPAENIKHCEYCKKEHDDRVVCPEYKEVLERRAAINETIPTPVAEPKKALTVWDTTPTNVMDPNVYLQIKQISHDMVESKALPNCYTNPYQVMMALQVGLEMGMTSMQAVQSLYIVNGAINVWGKAVTSRLRSHGWTPKYTDESEEGCTATIFRKDENGGIAELYTETFTFKEAEDSGYTKDSKGNLKIGWKLGVNRKLKLRYGVLSMLIKSYVPEVLGSAADITEVAQDYTTTEVNKVDAKADIEARIAEFKTRNGGSIVDNSGAPKPVPAQEQAGE